LLRLNISCPSWDPRLGHLHFQMMLGEAQGVRGSTSCTLLGPLSNKMAWRP
jgi:hypothetical protein